MYLANDSGVIAASTHDLKPFRLLRPSSVSEAVAALADPTRSPTLYAGGTDICASFREGKKVETLLWLRDIPDLKSIEADGTELRIGALATLDETAGNAALDSVPGLATAVDLLANVRIRFTATVGGNLMARRTAYEISILLTALDARLHFAAPEDNFELTPPQVWSHDEIETALLTHISIPLNGSPRLDYQRSLRPWMTQALAVRDGTTPRLAIATRFLRPHLLQGDPESLFDSLPGDFSDVLLSNDYIRGTGAALLARQLEAV